MSERLAQVKRDNDYLDEQEREGRREVESVGANRCCPQNARSPGRSVRVDRAFGVSGLKCCAFFATLIGKQHPARVRRMKKNPGGRRNEPQK